MTIKNILQIMIVVGLFFLAVGSAHAQVEKVSANDFADLHATVIDFEDANLMPGSQYAETHGVKFYGQNSQAIRINDYNRNGDRTSSGQYSITNDAIFPETSSNVPLMISFNHDVYAVGFYLGNGQNYGQNVKAHITIYNSNLEAIKSFDIGNIANPVTTFFGVKSTEPIREISIDYGATAISEDIDDVMFVNDANYAASVLNRNLESVTGIIGVPHQDAANSKQYESKKIESKQLESKQLTGCTDTDGTLIYQYGSQGVVYGALSISSKSQKYVDQCSSDTEVVEFVCDSGLAKKQGEYDCRSEGKICRQGACVPTSPSVIPESMNQPKLLGNYDSKPVIPESANKPKSLSNSKSDVSEYWNNIESNGIGEVSCQSGCKVDGKCLPIGTRLAQNEQELYCSWSGELKSQEKLVATCQNNYECSSNQCINSKCADIEKQLAETQSMIEQFKLWLASLWG